MWFNSSSIYVCPSICTSVASCPVTLPIPAVLAQNVIIISCLICVKKSDNYEFLVTLRSPRGGETELCTLPYKAWKSQAVYIKTHFSVSSLPSVGAAFLKTIELILSIFKCTVCLLLLKCACSWFFIWIRCEARPMPT